MYPSAYDRVEYEPHVQPEVVEDSLELLHLLLDLVDGGVVAKLGERHDAEEEGSVESFQ